MALIKCPECGKEISDKAVACVNCGFPIQNIRNSFKGQEIEIQKKINMVHERTKKSGWARMRKGFGIACLVIGIMFLIMIITSEGGIHNNSRMMGTSWFLLWCGGLQILGQRRKGFTIASIVFYSVGILYNLSFIAIYPVHAIIALMMLVFLILNSVSLSCNESFNK